MRYVIAAVIAFVIASLAIAFLAGLCAVIKAGDEMERELDDIEQAEYLHRWKERR